MTELSVTMILTEAVEGRATPNLPSGTISFDIDTSTGVQNFTSSPNDYYSATGMTVTHLNETLNGQTLVSDLTTTGSIVGNTAGFGNLLDSEFFIPGYTMQFLGNGPPNDLGMFLETQLSTGQGNYGGDGNFYAAIQVVDPPVSAPEPAVFGLMCLGLCAVLISARRRLPTASKLCP